jgi:hypothetical protein
MGKIHEIEPELVMPEQEIRVLHRELQQQNLAKTNRVLLAASVALMAVVLVLSSFLLSSRDLVTELKEKQLIEAGTALKNPVVSAEVDALKSQLIGLISGSIESKLKALEKNIERGRPLNALETVKSLKSDVKALRNYAKPPIVAMADKKVESVAVNALLVREVSQLKSLIYMTLGSCGLMFAALAGIWVKSRRQLLTQMPPYLRVENE